MSNHDEGEVNAVNTPDPKCAIFKCKRCKRRRRFYWEMDDDGGSYRCGMCRSRP